MRLSVAIACMLVLGALGAPRASAQLAPRVAELSPGDSIIVQFKPMELGGRAHLIALWPDPTERLVHVAAHVDGEPRRLALAPPFIEALDAALEGYRRGEGAEFFGCLEHVQLTWHRPGEGVHRERLTACSLEFYEADPTAVLPFPVLLDAVRHPAFLDQWVRTGRHPYE